MLKLSGKTKIISLIIFLSLVALFTKIALPKKSTEVEKQSTSPATSSKPAQDNTVSVTSTVPSPLNDTIVSADQVIEITFDKPLENTGELKMRIEPQPEIKLELPGDRKTIKIIPTKPYELGLTYTIFISPESKFDNGARLSEEKVFHFKTVKYRGFN